MVGEDFQSWSTTALSNGSADSLINWVEGMARNLVDDSARSMMAALAKMRNLTNGTIVTGGAANAQTFTSGVSYTAMPAAGLVVRLKIGFTNTASATLVMDSLTVATVINPDGTNLAAGQLTLNNYASFLWNGTNWILQPTNPVRVTRQVFLSGSGTYNTPAGCCRIDVKMCGGGGGGGGGTGSAGGAGGSTTFGTSFLTCTGGGGGIDAVTPTGIPAGGTGTGGDFNLQGGSGIQGDASAAAASAGVGGMGGANPFGGPGVGAAGANGTNASANTGAGGGGAAASASSTAFSGGGGAAGGYLEKIIMGPSATYAYAVGAGGAGVVAAGTYFNAGNGAAGIIIVTEYYA